MLTLTSPLQKLEPKKETTSDQISEKWDNDTPEDTERDLIAISSHILGVSGGRWCRHKAIPGKKPQQALANICALHNYCCLLLKAAAVQVCSLMLMSINLVITALAPHLSLTKIHHMLMFFSACVLYDWFKPCNHWRLECPLAGRLFTTKAFSGRRHVSL